MGKKLVAIVVFLFLLSGFWFFGFLEFGRGLILVVGRKFMSSDCFSWAQRGTNWRSVLVVFASVGLWSGCCASGEVTESP